MFAVDKARILGSIGQKVLGGAGNSVRMTATSPAFQNSTNVINHDFTTPLLESFLPKDNGAILNNTFREIYLMDHIAGPTVDIMSTLPWSDFNLTGVNDSRVRKIFEASSSELGIHNLMIQASVSYLVLGVVVGSLIFDGNKGIFTDLIFHNPDNCEITPIPLRGYDPKIDLKVDDKFKKFLRSKDARDREALKELNPEFMAKFGKSGKVELEPLNTLYLSRSYVPGIDRISYYYRILPIWLIEKALMRGTIIGAWRRQRSILHVSAGTDDWDPTDEQLDAIAALFQNADQDPQGAVVVTRPGLETNEIRNGSDFWRSSEDMDTFANAKMKALGISEAFLSGDACVTGDTLIPTNKGIVKIEDMCSIKDKKFHKINYIVDSLEKKNIAHKWLYNGYRQTFEIKTDNGNSIKCTDNHPFLVFKNGELTWKRMDELSKKDVLCISTNKVTRNTKLKLNLKKYECKPHGVSKNIAIPKYMTPELAFSLGVFVSEGWGNKLQIRVANSDKKLLNKFSKNLENIFDVEFTKVKSKRQVKGSKYCINNTTGTINKDIYCHRICSIELVDVFKQLGCFIDEKSNYAKKSNSWYKVIPWSILQADEESQNAFLAGFLEGDGRVGSRIRFCSTSKYILNGILAILNSRGLICRRYKKAVELQFKDSQILWKDIKKWMISKKLSYANNCGSKARNSFGIDNSFVKNLLQDRKICHNRHGIFFKNDNDETISFRGFKNVTHGEKKFLYDRFDSGCYDEFLDYLKQISKSTFDKLMYLFKCRYNFTKIISIRNNGKQDVYDLSMKDTSRPAFTANGIMVHNSYSNAEVALSIFMENLRAHRDFMTKNIIYDKIFLLISKYHGIRKRTQAEIKHNVRLSATSEKSKGHLDGSVKRLEQQERQSLIHRGTMIYGAKNLAEAANYMIPTIHWHKDLNAKSDQQLVDMYKSAEEKGIPIPLAMYASATGVNLDETLSSLETDIEIRKRIKEYNEKLAKEGLTQSTGEEGEEGGGGDENVFASVLKDFKPNDKSKKQKLKAFVKEFSKLPKENIEKDVNVRSLILSVKELNNRLRKMGINGTNLI